MKYVSLLILLVVFCPLAEANVGVGPVLPAAPTDQRECASYLQEWQQIAAEAEREHTNCLAGPGPNRPTPSISVCSKAQCQPLHDQWLASQAKATSAASEVQGCYAEVAAYQDTLNRQKATLEASTSSLDAQTAQADQLAAAYKQQAAAAAAEVHTGLTASVMGILTAAVTTNAARQSQTQPSATEGQLAQVDTASSAFKDLLTAATRQGIKSSGEVGEYFVSSLDKVDNVRSKVNFFDALMKAASGNASDSEKLNTAAESASSIFAQSTNNLAAAQIAGRSSHAVFSFANEEMLIFNRAVAGDTSAINDVSRLGFHLGTNMVPSYVGKLILMYRQAQTTWAPFAPDTPISSRDR